MPQPLPVFTVEGVVHSVVERTVQAQEAAPASRDERDRYVPAREAREAYDVLDVTVHTIAPGNLGGFCTLVIRADTLGEIANGVVPRPGDTITWPVWCSLMWSPTRTVGQPPRRVIRYSVPHDVAVAQAAASSKRPTPVAV